MIMMIATRIAYLKTFPIVFQSQKMSYELHGGKVESFLQHPQIEAQTQRSC
jgi:hypothetical protein